MSFTILGLSSFRSQSMIFAYIFASERCYSLSKYIAISKVELFAYLKISLIPCWAYLNPCWYSRLHLIPCNPQHQIDIFSFSEMTNCRGETTNILTRDSHFLGFEFHVKKREKWAISRREKTEKSRKILP